MLRALSLGAIALLVGIGGCMGRGPSQSGNTAATRESNATIRYADANNDGKVTRDEAKADPALLAAFDRYDENKDGVLDSEEFAHLVADGNARHGGEFARLEGDELAEQCRRGLHDWRCGGLTPKSR